MKSPMAVFNRSSKAHPNLNLKSLVLNIAQECNMDCSYCYATTDAGAGTYGEPSLMTEEVARRAVDFLFQQAPGKNVRIVFFGGEPLLNHGLIEKVVCYANSKSQRRNKNVYYELVTNATLMSDYVIRFLAENRVFVQVSLDGPKEVNDKHRRFPDGRGTHDTIVGNAIKLLEACGDLVSVRATVTKDGVRCFDTIMYLLKMGFQNISLTPVYTLDQSINLNMEDMKVISEELKRYADLFLKSALEWRLLNKGQFLDALKTLQQIRLDRVFQRSFFCGAGRSMLAVSAGGDLYPCHSFVGLPEYRLGDVFQGILHEKIGEYQSTIHRRKQGKCSECWAKNLCGGGCAYAALVMNKSLTVPYENLCVFLKTIYGLATEVYDEIYGRDPDVIDYLCKYWEAKPLLDELKHLLGGDKG
jgi:uncharacterized protein